MPECEERQEYGEPDTAEDRECARPQPPLDRQQRDRHQCSRIRLDERGDREQRECPERAVRQQQKQHAHAERSRPHVEAAKRERAEERRRERGEDERAVRPASRSPEPFEQEGEQQQSEQDACDREQAEDRQVRVLRAE